ncbi:hypothetical protein ACFO4N_01710 [Camelliibacillus cellulosilyticus]|uniref:FeS cluster biogenesis domain-containing protein n=1 Tax=Camelliibacillus cellulosilyticus TaxID=2174486 RepID=A0ABV9GHU0_9BACL
MLRISKRAAQFYKKEMELVDGDALNLFVRYNGEETGGFSFGVEKSPENTSGIIVEGITFSVKPEDDWLMATIQLDVDDDGKDLIYKRYD